MISREKIRVYHLAVLVILLWNTPITFSNKTELIALITTWVLFLICIILHYIYMCKNNTIKFATIKDHAIIPDKRSEDAGYDIYACFDEDYMTIMPHETKMIPTGLVSAFSEDYVVVLKERGSTGSKGMGQRCGIIDSGYRGEWFVPITNHNDKPIYIAKNKNLETDGILYPYSKAICQALVLPSSQGVVKEVPYRKLCKVKSKRGAGALGSSNK